MWLLSIYQFQTLDAPTNRSNSQRNLWRVLLYNESGIYKLQTQAMNDAGSWQAGAKINIGDAIQAIEIEYKKSTASGANDGSLKLWIDDTLVDTIATIDNDTRFVEQISLGAVQSLDAGTNGTLYFDEFESSRTRHIGLLSVPATPTPTPTETLTPSPSPTGEESPTPTEYDGLGQRLSMTGYAFGTSITTQYVLDSLHQSRPLLADSNGNVTAYVYGIEPIAEHTTAWAYSLTDGTGTARQLVNENGEITLTGTYTPWGDTLEYNGIGNFTFGYFGGLMDAATGLIYIGNGQYYDPSTGRLLTRDAQPNKTNPYVPWGDPTGALFVPIVLIGLLYGRRKNKSKFDYFMITLLLIFGVGMSLSACGPVPPESPTNTPNLPAPIVTIIRQPTETPLPSSTPDSVTFTVSPNVFPPYDPSLAVDYALRWANSVNQEFGQHLGTDCANFVSQSILSGINGNLPIGEWFPGSQAWVGTPALFKFLSSHFVHTVYENDKNPFGYSLLRGYQKWENFLQSYSIQPGDVVFYWDEDVAANMDLQIYPFDQYPERYTHTAMVVDIGPETEYADKNLVPANSSILKPLVVDHSGPTDILPRSIDDTRNNKLKKVAIIFMQRPRY